VSEEIVGLEAGSEVFVRVTFPSLNNDRATSEPIAGRFIVPPDGSDNHGRWQHHGRRSLRFHWGGDTAGQVGGINPAFGGMKIYEAMRQRKPLFFIHGGDTIYADGPIAESVVAENGQVWNNPASCESGGDAGRVPGTVPLQPACLDQSRPACKPLQTSLPAASGLFASRLPPLTGSPSFTTCCSWRGRRDSNPRPPA
jgi:hypothetical protein